MSGTKFQASEQRGFEEEDFLTFGSNTGTPPPPNWGRAILDLEAPI